MQDCVPSFLTIAMMPFGYSITTGIGLGILSYVAIGLCSYVVKALQYAFSKNRSGAVKAANNEANTACAEKPVWELHPVLLIIAALFIVYFFVPVTF